MYRNLIFTCQGVTRYRPAITDTGPLLGLAQQISKRCFAAYSPMRPKTRHIIHPYVKEPENLPQARELRESVENPKQQFLPVGYERARFLNSVRTGEYLGDDFPWNFLPQHYRRRRYNVTYHEHPWSTSKEKGINFYDKLQQWHVQWVENGVHRIRRFRAAYGILPSRLSAERFKELITSVGRVDNRRSERQIRMQHLQKKEQLKLKKKKFAKISSGLF